MARPAPGTGLGSGVPAGVPCGFGAVLGLCWLSLSPDLRPGSALAAAYLPEQP